MNICDIEDCEQATNVSPDLYSGILEIRTTTGDDLVGTAILTKGNGAILSQSASGGDTSIFFDFADNSYFLESAGNPYFVQFVGEDGDVFDIFLDSDGNTTTCFTFNVKDGIGNTAGTIILNPA